MALIKGKQLANGAIEAAKLADASITTTKLADNAITAAKITDGVVGSNKLANDAVTAAKLADNAVDTAAILDTAITGGKIADGAIASAKILDAAVLEAKLAANAVTTNKIADDAVTLAKIADAVIVSESEGIGSNDNDNTIPTSAAVKDYVDQNSAAGAVTSVSGTTNQIDVTSGATPVVSLSTTLQLPASTTAASAPTATDHVATKGYVDSVAQGLVIKDPVDYMFISNQYTNKKELTGRLEESFTFDATNQKWIQDVAGGLIADGATNSVVNGQAYIVYESGSGDTSGSNAFGMNSTSVGYKFTASQSGNLPGGSKVIKQGQVYGLKTNPDSSGNHTEGGDLTGARILVAPGNTSGLTGGSGIFEFTQGDDTLKTASTANLTNGRVYTIANVGDTNWTSIGASSGNLNEKFTYNGVAVTGSTGQFRENYILERTVDMPFETSCSGFSITVDKGSFKDKNFVITSDKYQDITILNTGYLNTNNYYEIVSVGDTNWTSLYGVSSPAAGLIFKPASSASLTGSGTFRSRGDIVGSNLYITQFSSPSGFVDNGGLGLDSSKYELDFANLNTTTYLNSDDRIIVGDHYNISKYRWQLDDFFEEILNRGLLSDLEEIISVGKVTSGSSAQFISTTADLDLSNSTQYNSVSTGDHVVVVSNTGSATRADLTAKGFVGVSLDLTVSTSTVIAAGDILKKDSYSSGAMGSSYITVNKIFTPAQNTGGAVRLLLNSLTQSLPDHFEFVSVTQSGGVGSVKSTNARLTSGQHFLRFNPTAAGFQLETDDDLRISYLRG